MRSTPMYPPRDERRDYMTTHLLLSLIAIVISFFLGRRMRIAEVVERGQLAFVVTKHNELGINFSFAVDGHVFVLDVRAPKLASREIALSILDDSEGTGQPTEPTNDASVNKTNP